MRSFTDYIAEVSKQQLGQIGSHVNQFSRGEISDRSLSSIFGDKSRIVVPLLKQEQIGFEKALTNAGYHLDLKSGIATSTVNTQQGPKKRTERIGAVLQKLSKMDKEKSQEWSRYLDWWQKQKPNIGKEENQGVSVIISRNPIDIVRMSDHSEWSSCHSPPGNKNNRGDGSFWKCALQEARTGGAVAYVVRNTDLSKVNLQAKDIFKDTDRGIDGIEPLERIRLRRFNNNDTDLIVPELRTYGIKHVGFYETVKNWAKQAQQGKVDFNNPPDMKDFDLHGGSYQDNNAGELWSRFFGKEYSGGKKSVDQEGETGKEMNADQLEERAQELINGHRYMYVSVHANVEQGDNEDYLDYSAFLSFRYKTTDFKTKLTDSDMAHHGRWNPKKESAPTFGAAIKNTLGYNHVIENMGVDTDNENTSIYIDLRDEEANGTLDQLEHFLDSLDELDNNYDKYKSIVTQELIEFGFLKDWRANWEQFKHFHFETDKEDNSGVEHSLYSDPMIVGNLDGLTTDQVGSSNNLTIKKEMMDAFIKTVFSDVILTHNLFSLRVHAEDKDKWFQWYQSFYSGNTYSSKKDWPLGIRVDLYFQLELQEHDDVMIKKIHQVDQYWEQYQERAVQWWNYTKQALMKKSATAPQLPAFGTAPTTYKQEKPVAQQPQQNQQPIQGQVDMGKNFKEWQDLLAVKSLQKLANSFTSLLNESGTRYSVEINYRSTSQETLAHFSKLVLGYVMAAMKQHNFHCKHIYTAKPNRILISTRNWDDGEWVGIVSYNEDHHCFVFTPGVYSKMRGTASFKPESATKCVGTSAAEITREVLNKMETLKNKPLRDGERFKPIHRKRGPQG